MLNVSISLFEVTVKTSYGKQFELVSAEVYPAHQEGNKGMTPKTIENEETHLHDLSYVVWALFN